MNGLDLFSGIGGLSKALKPWVTTVAYCERDRYAQGVLLSRMLSGDLERAPVWDDVTSLNGSMLPSIDIITGGFPCQDLSAAGLGKGLAGERSGLYFEIERLIKELKPTFVFLENVPAIRTRGLGRVVWGLSELGYDLRWTTVSAAEVGAPHLRKRWFMLAKARNTETVLGKKIERLESHRNHERLEVVANAESKRKRESTNKTKTEPARREARDESSDCSSTLADTKSSGRIEGDSDARWSGCGDGPQRSKEWSGSPDSSRWWNIEPNVGRVANGVLSRVDRLRCLGNSVVPEQAQVAFKRLIGLESKGGVA